jgi:DNA-binding beta-propeller fold protein YncE
MRILQFAGITIGALLMLGANAAPAQSQWSVTKTLHVGGEGGFDYLTVDAQSHRLFVPRTTHTQVIDADTGKVLGDIPGQKKSHGVALVPKLGRGFITDGGGTGAIVVFDLKSYAVLGTIPTVPDTDGITYDPKIDRVIAGAGDSGKLITFSPNIDPKNGKVDTIDLGGAPEFMASDGTGKVYINLEDKNVVAVVDLNAHKVLSRWPVAPAGAPVGMSMDKTGRRLFVGCRRPQDLVVMNADTGKVEAALPIGAGVDATIFSGDQAFASSGDGTLTVVAQKNGKFEVVQTVKTQPGAKTMGMDMTTHKIYMPTAEMAPGANGRPAPKPGTFMIVVVERK